MFPRKDIKQNAKNALSANYWNTVGILFLSGIIVGLFLCVAIVPMYVELIIWAINDGTGFFFISPISWGFYIVGLLLMFVYQPGVNYFAYKTYRGDSDPSIGDLFSGFKNGNFGRVLGCMLLMALKIFLWSLLLYIPAFIKAYEYRMIPYLLIDRPDLSVKECFKMARKMTKGYKWGMFVMDLSFIGWLFLSQFTFGLLPIFYVTPYMTLAQAGAYDFLKRVRMEAPEQQVETTYTEPTL